MSEKNGSNGNGIVKGSAGSQETYVKVSGNYVTCQHHVPSQICGLGDSPPTLCRHHEAGIREKKEEKPKIIETPAYGPPDTVNSPDGVPKEATDNAAKAAAKIISYCMQKDDTIEYGIAIYKRKDKDGEKFCLTETRKGEIGKSKVKNDNDIKDERYSFVAHVHSHPRKYKRMFSSYDYIESYGGKDGVLPEVECVDGVLPEVECIGDNFSKAKYTPFTIYLVARYQTNNGYMRKLIRFSPPEPRVNITKKLNYILEQSNGNEDVAQEAMREYIFWMKEEPETTLTNDIDGERI